MVDGYSFQICTVAANIHAATCNRQVVVLRLSGRWKVNNHPWNQYVRTYCFLDMATTELRLCTESCLTWWLVCLSVSCTGCSHLPCINARWEISKNEILRLNKTATWCKKMQILLMQNFSTCFGRHAPIIRSIKNTDTAATSTGSYGCRWILTSPY